MGLRVCRSFGCGALVPPGTRSGRCDGCRREQDQARGGRDERGYGADHVRERAKLAAAIVAGETVVCWRCGEPILTVDDLHLGHDDADRSITRGPEHARRCNLAAAGRAAHSSTR